MILYRHIDDPGTKMTTVILYTGFGDCQLRGDSDQGIGISDQGTVLITDPCSLFPVPRLTFGQVAVHYQRSRSWVTGGSRVQGR